MGNMFFSKKLCAALCILITIIMLLGALASCTPSDSGKESGSVTPGTETDTDNRESESETNTSTVPGKDTLKIMYDGKTDFQIVRAENSTDDEKTALLALREAILKKTGAEIPVVTDFERLYPVKEYEIIIGNTKRADKEYILDTSSLGNVDYMIKTVGNRIIIIGGSSSATLAATKYFISTIIDNADSANITLDLGYAYESIHKTNNEKLIKVMTQNLLATDTEYASHPEAGMYTIAKRSERIKQLILSNAPDVIGVQECSAPWREYFDKISSSIGYKRIGADKNQKIGILYDSNKYKVIKSASFWLSPDPEHEKYATEWNNGKQPTERLGMYVIFENKATGDRFAHFNTHVGFDTELLAQNQTKVLLSYIDKVKKEYDCPILITGDFNYTSTTAQYKTFTSGIMRDTKFLATKSEGAGSFNRLKDKNQHTHAVDQIMVSFEDWAVHSYKVDYTTFDGYFASDHFAVVSEIELLK